MNDYILRQQYFGIRGMPVFYFPFVDYPFLIDLGMATVILTPTCNAEVFEPEAVAIMEGV